MAKRRFQRRCYFCQQASMSEARYDDTCLHYQVLISLRLLFLVVRKIGFGKFFRIARWW
jgi:hypothetical protein